MEDGACFLKVVLSQVVVVVVENGHVGSCFLAGLTLTAWSDGLFVVLLCDHEALEVLSIDHAAVDLELAESVVDLIGGELLTPGHQGVTEHLCVDLAVDLEGFEGSHDDVIVVGSSGHLLGEQCHHLGEVDRSGGLSHHVGSLAVAYWPADGGEGGFEVGGGDDSILVVVDDAESFFELLDLFLTEEGEDV